MTSIFSGNCMAQNGVGKYSIKGRLLTEANHIGLGRFQTITISNKKTGHTDTTLSDIETGEFIFNGISNGVYNLRVLPGVFDVKSGDYFQLSDSTIIIDGRSLKNLNIFVTVNCKIYDDKLAKKGIETGRPLLFLSGGYSPIGDTNKYRFEKMYNIEYASFGCFQMEEDDCLISYNKTIFNYLDSAYGRKWRRKVRRDVIGFRKNGR